MKPEHFRYNSTEHETETETLKTQLVYIFEV